MSITKYQVSLPIVYIKAYSVEAKNIQEAERKALQEEENKVEPDYVDYSHILTSEIETERYCPIYEAYKNCIGRQGKECDHYKECENKS